MKTLLATLVLLASLCANASDSFMPSEVQLNGKSLHLNGTGLRKATLFSVKVYQAGLYVENLSHDPQDILNSPTSKEMRLRFVRNVGAEKIRGAFMEGFEHNCGTQCSLLKPQAEQINSWVTDMKDTDTMELDFLPDSVKLIIRGEERGTLKSPAYAKVLLATWLGNQPPTEELKKALLGISEK